MDKVEGSPILRPVPDGQNLMIPALDGQTKVGVGKVLESLTILPSLTVLNEGRPGKPTPAASFCASEIIRDANFLEIFGAVPGDWEYKWVSQSQAAKLYESYSGKLSPCMNFFLCKLDEHLPVNPENLAENLFVLRVGPRSSKSKKLFRASAGRLDYNYVWLGTGDTRVFFRMAPVPESIDPMTFTLLFKNVWRYLKRLLNRKQ
ncbi:MAG: hypothetical protein WC719_04125 [Patescibacteria group bacterium]|jgi:hypothetical protein